jgi:hypothetical protein
VLAEEGPALTIHDLGAYPRQGLAVGGVLGLKLPAEHVVVVLGHPAWLELHEVGPLRPLFRGLELLPRVRLQPLRLVRGEGTSQDLGLNLTSEGSAGELRGASMGSPRMARSASAKSVSQSDRQRAKGCLAFRPSFVPRLFVHAHLPVHGAGIKAAAPSGRCAGSSRCRGDPERGRSSVPWVCSTSL